MFTMISEATIFILLLSVSSLFNRTSFVVHFSLFTYFCYLLPLRSILFFRHLFVLSFYWNDFIINFFNISMLLRKYFICCLLFILLLLLLFYVIHLLIFCDTFFLIIMATMIAFYRPYFYSIFIGLNYLWHTF